MTIKTMTKYLNLPVFCALIPFICANSYAREESDYVNNEDIEQVSAQNNSAWSIKGFYALAMEDNPVKERWISADAIDLAGVAGDFTWAFPSNSSVVVPEFCLSGSVGYGQSELKLSYYQMEADLSVWSVNVLAGANVRFSSAGGSSFFIGPRLGANYLRGTLEFQGEEGTEDDIGICYGVEAGFHVSLTPNDGLTFGVSWLASEANPDPEFFEKQSWTTFSVGYRHTF